VADRSRPESIPVREDARRDHVERQQMCDQESHHRAHGWRDSRVGMPETARGLAAPRGGGFQRRLGRQQQRDDPRARTGPGQDHRGGVPRQRISYLHGHLARTHQKVRDNDVTMFNRQSLSQKRE